MKILFICGGLEPGRDGIGDYIRLLAGELAGGGHKVAAISINDHQISGHSAGVQYLGQMELPVLRISSGIQHSLRRQLATDYVRSFDPDWMSLQYVASAFDPKGLPLRLGFFLRQLGSKRRWHIMFHELWLGMNHESSAKLIWWGRAQQGLIRLLIRQLQPCVIHTQTQLYRAQLRRIGYAAKYLPIFSNIPVENPAPRLGSLPFSGLGKGDEIAFVLFGSIHPDAPVAEFSEEVKAFGTKHGVIPILRIAGRCGEEQDRWVEAWSNAGLQVDLVGEQPPAKISAVLSQSTIGICTTAYPIMEKSGAVAAMLAHGLPIICVAPTWNPRYVRKPEMPAAFLEYQPGKLALLFETSLPSPHFLTPAHIAGQFETDLTAL